VLVVVVVVAVFGLRIVHVCTERTVPPKSPVQVVRVGVWVN